MMDYATLLKFFPEPLRELILGDDISDVMLNDADGTVRVFVDRAGQLELADGVTMDAEGLVMAIQNVARLLVRILTAVGPFSTPACPMVRVWRRCTHMAR
jgi:Flp pilus assembly CpaF family ATPase